MTGLVLKLIAVVTMFLDHIGSVFFPGTLWLRYVGRLAFPIYCFLIVEGFLHTRNLKAYMWRLFAFALISEIPFDMAFYGKVFDVKHQNVFWTMLFGLMAISLMSLISLENMILESALRLLIAAPFAVTAQLIHTDYRWVGVYLIAVMYVFHDLQFVMAGCVSFLMLPVFTNALEYVGIISLIPITMYNGRRGYAKGTMGKVIQWTFYILYPVHLIIFTMLRDHLMR
ncbi:MAG: TraX protein [Lachnospiraceae bacterium]|nr:TraX protein [Lachnospiraceae bacterium]